MNRTTLSNILWNKKLTISKISRKRNIPRRTLYHVLSGTLHSRRIESELEEIFEMTIAEIQKAWELGYRPIP